MYLELKCNITHISDKSSLSLEEMQLEGFDTLSWYNTWRQTCCCKTCTTCWYALTVLHTVWKGLKHELITRQMQTYEILLLNHAVNHAKGWKMDFTWSNGHCFRWRFAKQCLHIVCEHPRLIGLLAKLSNWLQQIGHDRNSVHWGAWIGILEKQKKHKHRKTLNGEKYMHYINTSINLIIK